MSNPFDDLEKERENARKKQEEKEAERSRILKELTPKYDKLVREVLNQLKEAKYRHTIYAVNQATNVPVWRIVENHSDNTYKRDIVSVTLELDSNNNPSKFYCRNLRIGMYLNDTRTGLSREELIRGLDYLEH